MRELTMAERDAVAGAGLNLISGAAGALLGGSVAGANYAIQAGAEFSWAGFTYTTTSAAASGFLIGTGVGIIGAAAAGTMPGATVLGVTFVGVGSAIGATAPLALETEQKDGGS